MIFKPLSLHGAPIPPNDWISQHIVTPFALFESPMHPHDHLFSFLSVDVALKTAGGLVWLAVRRPRLFARLLLAGIRDRHALIRLLRLPVDLDTIRRSPLFDRDWYLRNHPDAARSGMPPELCYLLHEVQDEYRSSPRFSGEEYLALNPEVRASGVNPLVHYEQCGRFISLPVNKAEAFPKDPEFPEGAVDQEETLIENPPWRGRTAVFATFSPDGRLPEKDVHFIRALGEVCDNVAVVVNAPLFPEEVDRVRGIASALVCRWHGGYDFGSYRIGLETARRLGWLAPERCRELVFANGSCFAPVFPFSEMFREMASRPADFWGVCRNSLCCERPYVQSFFLVFRQSVFSTSALDDFFAARPTKITRTEAVSRFELQLTPFLEDRGFSADSFVPVLGSRFRNYNPTTRPLTLLRRYRVPLVKVKAMSGQTIQDPERVVSFVRRHNSELAAVMLGNRRQPSATVSGAPSNPRGPTPSISVFISVFNGEATLARALESILAQTFVPCEILVLDDGSTDGSISVAERYADRGVRAIRLPHQGVYAVRNEALRLVKGDWFFNLDADDWVEPDFLARAATRIPSLPSRMAVLYPDLRRFGLRDDFEAWPDYSPERLKVSNFIVMSSVIRTSAAREVGFDPSFATGMGDYDFFLSLAERGYAAESLRGSPLHYEIHEGSISAANRKFGRCRGIVRRLAAKHAAFFSREEARRIVRLYTRSDSREVQAAALRDISAGRHVAAAAKLLRAVWIAPYELPAIICSGIRRTLFPKSGIERGGGKK